MPAPTEEEVKVIPTVVEVQNDLSWLKGYLYGTLDPKGDYDRIYVLKIIDKVQLFLHHVVLEHNNNFYYIPGRKD